MGVTLQFYLLYKKNSCVSSLLSLFVFLPAISLAADSLSTPTAWFVEEVACLNYARPPYYFCIIFNVNAHSKCLS